MRASDRGRGRGVCLAVAAFGLLLLLAAPRTADAMAGKANARRTEHKARGWSNPNHPSLKAYENQGALVRMSVEEKPILTIPTSFVGLSYDIDDIVGVASSDYITLLKQLAQYDTGPLVLRVGAAITDRMTTPWSNAVLKALVTINRWTGAKFILGVNLHSEKADITKAQIKRIQDTVPGDAIMSFSVGNEPDMYALKPKDGKPGAIDPKPERWLNDKWVPVSREIFKAASGGKPILAGPAWSTLNMKPPILKWWLDSVAPYLDLVTLHHYAGNIFDSPSIEDLLSEKQMTKDMSNLNSLVKVAEKFTLPVRVTEAAILSYGGVQGVSDVAGSAIWVLDTAMEVAYRGAHGINFHQSIQPDNNANYNAVDVKDGQVRVRMPFYGYLLLQQALDGGADILGRGVVGECKAWVLKGHKKGDLRVLVVNKVNAKDCGVDIKLSKEQAKRFRNEADVDYLFAGAGLYEKWQMYLSGLTFETYGPNHVRGDGDDLMVSKYWNADKTGGFAVTMLPGTKAMLVTIPPW